MTEAIKIKLLGVFKKAYGSDQILLDVKTKEKLRDAIQSIVESCPELRRLLIDPELNSPLPNTIILVNGIEIGVLNGLDTEVKNQDEIVLIPVTHGG